MQQPLEICILEIIGVPGTIGRADSITGSDSIRYELRRRLPRETPSAFRFRAAVSAAELLDSEFGPGGAAFRPFQRGAGKNY